MKAHAANLDDIAVSDLDGLLRLDALACDQRAVGAVQIHDMHPIGKKTNLGVDPRDPLIICILGPQIDIGQDRLPLHGAPDGVIVAADEGDDRARREHTQTQDGA